MEDPRSSFTLLDLVRFGDCLISGRLLLRSATGTGGLASPGKGNEVWQQVFAVLTERSLFWLSPPSSQWSSLSMENAHVTQDKAAPEALEIGSTRVSLHFRCRSALVASRWAEAVSFAAENATSNVLLEGSETIMMDRLENHYQTRAVALIALASTQETVERINSKKGAAGSLDLIPTGSNNDAPTSGDAAGGVGGLKKSTTLTPSEDETFALGFSRLVDLYARTQKRGGGGSGSGGKGSNKKVVTSAVIPAVSGGTITTAGGSSSSSCNKPLMAYRTKRKNASAVVAAAPSPGSRAEINSNALLPLPPVRFVNASIGTAMRASSTSAASAMQSNDGSGATPHDELASIAMAAQQTQQQQAAGRVSFSSVSSSVRAGGVIGQQQQQGSPGSSSGAGGNAGAQGIGPTSASLQAVAAQRAKQAVVQAFKSSPILVEASVIAGCSATDLLRAVLHLQRTTGSLASQAMGMRSALKRLAVDTLRRRQQVQLQRMMVAQKKQQRMLLPPPSASTSNGMFPSSSSSTHSSRSLGTISLPTKGYSQQQQQQYGRMMSVQGYGSAVSFSGPATGSSSSSSNAPGGRQPFRSSTGSARTVSHSAISTTSATTRPSSMGSTVPAASSPLAGPRQTAASAPPFVPPAVRSSKSSTLETSAEEEEEMQQQQEEEEEERGRRGAMRGDEGDSDDGDEDKEDNNQQNGLA
jgi:hypothetical protein